MADNQNRYTATEIADLLHELYVHQQRDYGPWTRGMTTRVFAAIDTLRGGDE